MPVINRVAELHDEIAQWRREFHADPELGFDVHRTAAKVAAKLREFGCDEVVEGIGRTGVVAVIRGRMPGATGKGAIGLRADMDALPIHETTGLPHASKNEGKMHACGHDGHTAMLLGAAKYLAETRNFSGNAVLIFQPAEEDGGGGEVMVREGLMERFAISEVYGLHNEPGLAVGHFSIRPGPIMAATAEFTVRFTGLGGHAAAPHEAADPLIAAAHCATALQAIVSRNADPVSQLVVSVTQIHGGFTHNVIAGEAWLAGTIRFLEDATGDIAETRLRQTAAGIAATFGVTATVEVDRSYPVTVNHAEETKKAVTVARAVAGDRAVDPDVRPTLGGEDFSFMLQARPGAYIQMGNGETAKLHNAGYDFNDEAIPHGVSYWVKLVEMLRAV